MTFTPMMPLPLVAAIFVVFAAFIVWQLLDPANRARRSPWLLRGGMVILIVFVLLRPGIPGGAGGELRTDADVFFVVDTTTSIVAEDWAGAEPRLEGVKADIAATVKEYPGARFALLSFDSSAVLRVPLTSDATAVANAARVLTPEITLYSAGSSITEAAGLLASTLGRSHDAAPERSSIVYYFGDGEQTSDEQLGDFSNSQDFIAAGYVFGYGTSEGGPMRTQTGYYGDSETQNDYVTDSRSNKGISVIDEDNLRAIAGQLGLKYQHRSAANPVPQAASVGSATAGGDTAAGTIELYWIPAALLAVLATLDLGRSIRRLRQIQAATSRAAPSSERTP